jgi:flagellin
MLAGARADLGANLARYEAESSTLSVLKDNLSAARSRIADVDVAQESANFARQQILVQSGTAMLAQANVLPQSALRLIG